VSVLTISYPLPKGAIYGTLTTCRHYAIVIIVRKQRQNNRIKPIMSKNNKYPQHTRPVSKESIADHYNLPQQPLSDYPSTTEGPSYIITHESKLQLRHPHTEVFRGDIEQWIKDNPQLYITHITKL
jgi:hypothetical protein